MGELDTYRTVIWPGADGQQAGRDQGIDHVPRNLGVTCLRNQFIARAGVAGAPLADDGGQNLLGDLLLCPPCPPVGPERCECLLGVLRQGPLETAKLIEIGVGELVRAPSDRFEPKPTQRELQQRENQGALEIRGAFRGRSMRATSKQRIGKDAIDEA
jgi:hypothetical protein